MRNFKLFVFLISGLIISCSKNDEIELNCLNGMLSDFGMTEYQGQEIGCDFFLELYHYNQKQYYLLGNHCADMISYPTDCEGNKLCENGDDNKCGRFYKNAVRIGVVGVML